MLKLSLHIIEVEAYSKSTGYYVEALWSDTDITLPINRKPNQSLQYYFHSKCDLLTTIIPIFDKCEVDALNLFFSPNAQQFATEVKIMTGQATGNKNLVIKKITSSPDEQKVILSFFRSSKLNITVY